MLKVIKRRDGSFIVHMDENVASHLEVAARNGEMPALADELAKKMGKVVMAKESMDRPPHELVDEAPDENLPDEEPAEDEAEAVTA